MPHFRQLLYEVIESIHKYEHSQKRYTLYWYEESTLRFIFSDSISELCDYKETYNIPNGTIIQI